MISFLTTPLPEDQIVFLKSSLVILYLILAALVLSCIVLTFIMLRSPMEGNLQKVLMVLLFLVTAFVLISTIVCSGQYNKLVNDTTLPAISNESTTLPATNATEAPTAPIDQPTGFFTASHTGDTDPQNWNIKWEIMQNSTVLSSFSPADAICFGDANSYSAIDGVITFRGNNYRDCGTFGLSNIEKQIISINWHSETGALNEQTNAGWSGQPLIVRWDNETKKTMNLYEEKKAKEGLVEVIYAALDGKIYFYDLDDGTYTRDPIMVGMRFTCSGSLDPRGYPLLYVGSNNGDNKSPRFYIISLIDGSVLYEQTGSDIDAYYRQFTFDTSPLLDAESDMLIWLCESGIIYFTKLNTTYTPETGTVSVKPDKLVKLRYKTNLSRKVGISASPLIIEHYLYFADNEGMIYCVDLRTLNLVWAQDLLDRICATPVFQKGENSEAYLYTATASEYNRNTCYLRKLDARTGQILWEHAVENVNSGTTIPGGVLSSPILGTPETTTDGLIIYSIARAPKSDRGMLIALDTATGNPVWEHDLAAYTWSSPIALYTTDGIGYLVLCDSAGKVSLYEGASGNILDYVEIGSGINASPAAFGNTLVVSTTDQSVYSFKVE